MVADDLVHLMGFGALGQLAVIDVAEGDSKERQSERDEGDDRGDEEDHRSFDNGLADTSPAPARSVGMDAPLASAQKSGQIKGVDPATKDEKQSRQHQERRGRRNEDDRDARVGERTQVVHGEDEHCGERDGHCERGKGDGTAGCGQGGTDGSPGIGPAVQLFPLAAHDEQPVVHGESEAECGG